MKILVKAPIGSTGGYARDGVGLIQALLRARHEVDVVPTAVAPPLPPDVAELLTFPTGDAYDLEIHHVPPTDVDMGAFNRRRSRKVVLWSMWEWDTFPSSVAGFEKIADNMKQYDMVVGYTKQSLDAFRGAGFLGDDQATAVVQGGFDPSPWKAYQDTEFRDEVEKMKFPNAPFRFGMVGHLSLRKNPYTVLRAFNELKEEHGDQFNAQLVLKTGFPLLPPQYDAPGVKFIQEINWTDKKLKEFYWTLDCLINVSWGEGKDLPSMEATMCGIPTILNDTPGHRGWVHPDVQKLIPATKMQMDSEYVGLFTGVEDVKSAMMETYSKRTEAYRRARQLASVIGRSATWDTRVKRFGKALGLPL